ncbi:membrane-bound lytic murein transglycosylase B [Marinobacter persicus]|uniref:Membrane-bound lytic murein transglycosylase B n=1 Tax=Marinobacter persicus TaxID=930118 RepID=A0A2S6G4T6_9GAMM|nr:membrane-bound lytic murein transglycosylase B [Marinobacter persicus]PPK54104.1 membrane-bound lytic murein transglycosylase B [Marinobacter persicus]PPK57291.1 membrane-bound lytic murein transglycosylase B [Marinobacter persicus]
MVHASTRKARWHVVPALGLASLLISLPAQAEETLSESEFAQCKQRLEERAINAGVSAPVARDVMARAEYLDRVIELDRRQPEFTTTFAEYLNRRVNADRIARGRELLREHRGLLNEVTEKTGVPAPYLVAFWGLETNYGSYFGKMQVPSSLATLACDPRRSEFFSQQLIAALRIIDEGAISADQMEGSWAGAMGHVQFMPTVFLRHAVDADGDGRRDLWNSLPDAMLSAGRFLESMGWDGEYRWGREVLLPNDFDYSLADGRRLPLDDWREMGVTDVWGHPVPDEPIDAAMVVPSGHEGPAFLVYNNFRVTMGWNRSEFYAIAVGHLADRVAGAGGLHTPPPEDQPALSRDQILQLQEALNQKGFSSGEPDGILGSNTRNAIRRYQSAQDMIADGFPSREVLESLAVKGISETDDESG